MVEKTRYKENSRGLSMIPYSRQYINDHDIQSVVDVLRSDYLTTGPTHRLFEKKFSEYVGSKFAVSFSSGTAALHAAASICIKKGDEAITSPNTFLASANCILYCNGKVRFSDIYRGSFLMNPFTLKITNKTKAIIPVDFAGVPCDHTIIQEMAYDDDLVVIQDASHSLGATYNGKKVGSFSDMTTFSFHPVKHITTGEGGMVTTNNEEYYEKLLAFRNHGMVKNIPGKPTYYYEMQSIGYNYRLSDIHSALGITQLSKLDTFVSRRQQVDKVYREELSDTVKFQFIPSDRTSSCHLTPILVKNRDEIYKKLKKLGIGVQIHYIPVYRQPYYKNRIYRQMDYPECEKYYKHTLSLPNYPFLQSIDQRRVIKELRKLQ